MLKFDLVKDKYLMKSETYVYVENHKIKGSISLSNNGYIGAMFVRLDSLG